MCNMRGLKHLPVILLFSVVACVTPGPTPPLPSPTATWRTDAVACKVPGDVPYACQEPIPGATVQMHGPDGYVTQTADGAGYAAFSLPAGFVDSDVLIDAPGYLTARAHIDVAGTHDSERHNIVVLAPVPPPAPELRIKGRDFVDADGKRIVLNGCDQFRAFRMFLDGADLEPLFTESRELGFNMWRVFMQGSAAQNQVLDLRPTDAGYYEGVRPFADLLNAHGIILLATVYVDDQDVQAGLDHWQKLASRLRGSGTLLSGFNQWTKNKSWFGPAELSEPGMIWSRGSDVEDRETPPNGASFAEFHTRRDMPAMLMDTVASPVYLYGHGLTVPLIMSEPIGFAETDQPGKRSNDPALAWRLARHYSTEYSAVVFHSDAGIRSQLMGKQTRRCAEAWTRGMRP